VIGKQKIQVTKADFEEFWLELEQDREKLQVCFLYCFDSLGSILMLL